MRRLSAILVPLLTIALIWLLDHPLGSLPAIGRLLDPVNGALAAAEPVDNDFNLDARIKGLKAPVAVWLEDRLVPHVKAQNDHDLYFTQGYIHARFRLWQMDMQTRAAAGWISAITGPKAIRYDRGQRRKGMVYAAEQSVQAMEADPQTKLVLDAYRDGINAYISSLSFRDLPLEYKLMGFRPEPWTNLRTSLMLKYMADYLTGKTDDISYTLLRDQLGQEQFDFLFPEKIAGSKPVIPEGTKFAPPSLPIPNAPGDSVWAHLSPGAKVAHTDPPHPQFQIPNSTESGIGSNNWAISGQHTASGAPILCNDPHLGLNLPSLWYEVQLQAPGVNVYGVSLPGAPGIIIGFNDSLSWGMTNNYRDVKDYYAITANGRETYLFNGRQVPFQKRVERIAVKGGAEVLDTVLYTVHGPVEYEPTFRDPDSTGSMLAVTWMGHRATNELKAVYNMNRAKSYEQWVAGIHHFECPAQNFVYADRSGNIAMWGQGRFINKWKGQGKYVMKGTDSNTLWEQSIPMAENPHVLNPPQGYVASANQAVTDDSYPYWYNGNFVEFRSWEINYLLALAIKKQGVLYPPRYYPNGDRSRPDLCFRCWFLDDMQTIVWSILVDSITRAIENAPIQFIGNEDFDPVAWDRNLTSTNIQATSFQVWWYLLYKNIWQDEFSSFSHYPSSERTMQLLLTDSASQYYDDRRTNMVEKLRDVVNRSYKETGDSLGKLKHTTGLEWYKVKNTTVAHLTKLPAFSYDQIKIGGWSNTINAVTNNHGPSWRMIVEMGRDSIRGFGVYPGGQSGNPGSPYYASMLDHWTVGKYYPLRFLSAATSENPFKYDWNLQPG